MIVAGIILMLDYHLMVFRRRPGGFYIIMFQHCGGDGVPLLPTL